VKVLVHGLWHLGTVTAACLADRGHQVVGLDFDAAAVAGLARGILPVQEPGLGALVTAGLASGRLRFTTDPAAAAAADLVWVTHDTPVDAEDRADVGQVIGQVERLFPHLMDGTVVLVSAQLPVGSVARLEAAFRTARSGVTVHFGCSPENLRLGKAIQVFTAPDRVVVGVRTEAARVRVTALLAPITDRLEWMSVESAEMTKHALNAFLAVSVTFANEVAAVCEQVGADAREVERGLKSEARIGPRAYLAPGAAFAGGTLARDVAFLSDIGTRRRLELPLLGAVRPSNEWHKHWAGRRLAERLGQLQGLVVAVWGLTYKPGTDTLRRSAAVEFCEQLAGLGATVQAFDPAVAALPAGLAARITLAPSAAAALAGASALVVTTEWPQFREVALAAALPTMKRRLVLDPNRFLAAALAGLEAEHVAVGVAGTEVARGQIA
jgi:UDPglucose 6-dehydrogenase